MENKIKKACDGMFNLNRYAKHRTCNYQFKRDIYKEKDKLIENLYQHGFEDKIFIQTKQNNYKLYVFIFKVDGQKFIWHLPVNKCDFKVELTDEIEYPFEMFEKEIFIPKNKLVSTLKEIKHINKNFKKYIK